MKKAIITATAISTAAAIGFTAGAVVMTSCFRIITMSGKVIRMGDNGRLTFEADPSS